MDIYEIAKKVETQEDFVNFLQAFRADFEQNQYEWENSNLSDFLNGLEGYCSDKKQDGSGWKILAEILLAARVYE